MLNLTKYTTCKFFLILTFLFSFVSFAEPPPQVTTKASNSSEVIYVESEKHPAKMNWENMTFCYGSAASSKSGRAGAHANSTANKGSLNNLIGLPGPVGTILGNQLQWESVFDQGEMTFNINIHRKIGSKISTEDSRSCVTYNWDYQIDKATALVETSVNLKVPDHVWVMRIKTVVNKSKFAYKAEKVRPLPGTEDLAQNPLMLSHSMVTNTFLLNQEKNLNYRSRSMIILLQI